MGGRQGAHSQLVHTVTCRPARPHFSPPLAHRKSAIFGADALRQPALDLRIKAEQRDSFFPFSIPIGRSLSEQEQSLSLDQQGSPEDSRLKAKEKSKQYREKQKLQRMTDATYDMIFRQRVAERKRRQRLREKLKKVHYGFSSS